MAMQLRRLAFPSVFVVALVMSATASTAEFDADVSCVKGVVAGNSFAEFDQNFSEGVNDMRARMELVSENTQLKLDVLDVDGNSVCEETADLDAECRWSLGLTGTYAVRIDNTASAESSGYSVCLR